MKLSQHDIEVISHHRAGGEVASRRKDQPDVPFTLDINPTWNFEVYEYKKAFNSKYFYMLKNNGKVLLVVNEEGLRKLNDFVELRNNTSDEIWKLKKVWSRKASSPKDLGG